MFPPAFNMPAIRKRRRPWQDLATAAASSAIMSAEAPFRAGAEMDLTSVKERGDGISKATSWSGASICFGGMAYARKAAAAPIKPMAPLWPGESMCRSTIWQASAALLVCGGLALGVILQRSAEVSAQAANG